jgi:hypothetical protein
MDMKTYVYDETLAKLKEVVKAKGEDFVYYGDPNHLTDPSCFYVKNGEPDCGVGHVLIAFDVPSYLLESEGGFGYMFAEGVLAELARRGIAVFDSQSRSLLMTFQRHQDAHIPWGESLQRAIKYTEGLHN